MGKGPWRDQASPAKYRLPRRRYIHSNGRGPDWGLTKTGTSPAGEEALRAGPWCACVRDRILAFPRSGRFLGPEGAGLHASVVLESNQCGMGVFCRAVEPCSPHGGSEVHLSAAATCCDHAKPATVTPRNRARIRCRFCPGEGVGRRLTYGVEISRVFSCGSEGCWG